MVMELEKRKAAFVKLGEVLAGYSEAKTDEEDKLDQVISTLNHYNGWFTEENVRNALSAWGESLKPDKLDKWLSSYDLKDDVEPVKIGLVMAGNIPMVGFHDLLSVLITGNKALVRFSSDDNRLIPAVLSKLFEIEPAFVDYVEVADGKMADFNAVIATGSNNSSRYFEYYFGKYPHIIRKNRNSAAVLSGKESREELTQLGKDIFKYFGLGCRNVSKLYIPKGYIFDDFFQATEIYSDIVNHKKYGNNYDYNKAIYLVNQEPHLDSGFLLLKEEEALASPVSAVHYEFYYDEEDLNKKMASKKDEIQCIVGNIEGGLAFGKTQEPELWDYADGVDTIEFILQQQTAKAL